MTNREELNFALRFIAEHPQSAIKIIEKSDIESVAGLVATVPPDFITPVLKYMIPEYTARLCSHLSPEKASVLLSTMDANAIAGILRKTDPEIRPRILEELPSVLKKSTELLLEFPLNTVGAWMSPHYLSVASDLKCKNILKYLKAGGIFDDSEYIFVIDRDGKFQGRTQFLNILRANEDQQVSEIMDKSCPSLPVQMDLAQSLEHKSWDFFDVLPVTNREHKLLGILQHYTLRNALKQKRVSWNNDQKGKDPVSSIFEVYGQSLIAILNTVSDAVEPEHNNSGNK